MDFINIIWTLSLTGADTRKIFVSKPSTSLIFITSLELGACLGRL